jgi:ketosteroid isomerase-like protein
MELRELIETMQSYGKAWEGQNPDALIALFTEDGTYQEKPYLEPMQWHDAIRAYWIQYPVSDQRNITFTLWKCNVVEDTWYAERVARFDQIESWLSIELYWIMIITMKEWKIATLREYWHSKKWQL